MDYNNYRGILFLSLHGRRWSSFAALAASEARRLKPANYNLIIDYGLGTLYRKATAVFMNV